MYRLGEITGERPNVYISDQRDRSDEARGEDGQRQEPHRHSALYRVILQLPNRCIAVSLQPQLWTAGMLLISRNKWTVSAEPAEHAEAEAEDGQRTVVSGDKWGPMLPIPPSWHFPDNLT